MTADVVVVGGGFAGLAIATRLTHAGADVVVCEAGPRVGGKVAGGVVGGCTLDVGADAWLDRDSCVRDLVSISGLDDQVIGMATAGVWLWTARGLHRMPPTAVMGIPRRPSALTNLLGLRGALRAAAERWIPTRPIDHDVSVGEFLSRRFGTAVASELVDPLLGGVYAGHVDQLSLHATIPALVELASGSSITRAVRNRPSVAPAFLTLRRGLHRLPAALAAQLGERVRIDTPVVAIERQGDSWAVNADGGLFEASRVVLACPAPAVASLVRPYDDDAAATAASVAHASVAVVALAYPAELAWPIPEGTGMLVSRSADRFIKAATWVSNKWGRPLGVEPLLVRASVGRIDDDRHRHLTDEEVIALATADLAEAVGLGDPTDAIVVRWDDALPQYRVGHLTDVARLRTSLAASMPGVHLLGAAWDGVGLGPLATAAAGLADALLG